jgi:hypothetical protein
MTDFPTLSGLRAEVERQVREALPDAHCGPEWRSRHAPECRQEDFEDVMARLTPLLNRFSGRDDGLDAAWREAEATLPEGVELFLTKDVLNEPDERYEVEASARTLTEGRTGADWTFSADFKAQIAYGPTPAAALRNLAARLSRYQAMTPYLTLAIGIGLGTCLGVVLTLWAILWRSGPRGG